MVDGKEGEDIKIVIASNSFKGSLTAKEVCEAIETGILQYMKDAEIVKVPMADGGEGLVETIVDAADGKLQYLTVMGPMGDPVEACYGILGDKRTAVIEMASASGLPLVSPEKLDPLLATTYGTGELIKSALDKGCRNFYIGIGGSATNDGGVGMAQALGIKFLDRDGGEIGPGGGSLDRLAKIDASHLDQRIRESIFQAACDVTNPLCGKNGASLVFGPQKGASPEMAIKLDNNLFHLAEIINRDLDKEVMNVPGAGAGGGMSAGLMAFCGAGLKRGIDLVIEITRLKQKIQGASLVITGEGRMDRQTSQGKTPYGVARLAKELGIPAVAIVGSIGDGMEEMFNHGIQTVFSIVNRPGQSLEECMKNAAHLVADTANRLIRAVDIKM